MSHSFLAFIDESGDDGLKKYRQPQGVGGASNWLIISALVYRASRSLDAVKWRNEITNVIKKKELHFVNLNHNQKVVASRILGEKPVRCISVMSLKPTIEQGVYQQKNQLYFYLTRYLIERLSWLCRDMRPSVPEGDGRVKITFSRRGGMSYDDFKTYMIRLKNTQKDIKIHWPVIDIDAVDAQDHARLASLQLADIVASSFGAAVEHDMYGNCETRYVEQLLPITYHRKNNYFSYGVKVIPSFEQCNLSNEQMRFINIFRNE